MITSPLTKSSTFPGSSIRPDRADHAMIDLDKYMQEHVNHSDKTQAIVLADAAEAKRVAGSISDPVLGSVRIKSICGVELGRLHVTHLIFIMKWLGIQGGRSRSPKPNRLHAIESFKLGVLNAEGIAEGTIVPGSTSAASSPNANRGTQAQRRNAIFRGINTLFHPLVRPLYQKFNLQPSTHDLTAGIQHNAELYQTFMELYNDSNNDCDDMDEDHPINEIHFKGIGSFDGVDPSNVTPLESTRVAAGMIAQIHKLFNTARRNWTKSGNNRDRADDSLVWMLYDVFGPDDTELDFEGVEEDRDDEDARFIVEPEVQYYASFLKTYRNLVGSSNADLPAGALKKSTDVHSEYKSPKKPPIADLKKERAAAAAALVSMASNFNEKVVARGKKEEEDRLRRAIRDEQKAAKTDRKEIAYIEKEIKNLKKRIGNEHASNTSDTSDEELKERIVSAKAEIQELRKSYS